MKIKQLSLRLERAASYVPEGSRLADIGSDHAYLPCVLATEGKIEFAVAGEIIEGPFQIAENQVKRLNLQNEVFVRLGDGLEVITPDADQISVVTICGMGGVLIATILDEGYQMGKLTGKERLVLQPNKDEAELRMWLIEHNYQVIAEELVEENKKIYEIIIAEKSNKLNVPFLGEDIAFGFFLREERSPLFIKKWMIELAKNEQILADLTKSSTDQSDKIYDFKNKIDAIKELLK
ncbi:tRNA (adenine(22)-N(1))-methyltransferase [Carnobacterium funditum]|uniref:tRNA (adenine(22)-N(1))-methyltransferase n=1 Tax=Carnobacterium funditum TaxID=2752 RepID=UPI0005561181|nr:tRNA (adenine(22)-N(1))-methyltransferase TrmK [Carnobacterium funditum]